MNMWNNVVNAWWPLVFFPATDAPKFYKGMWAMIGTCIATLFVTAFVRYMERREWRIKAAESDEVEPLEELEWRRSDVVRQTEAGDEKKRESTSGS